MTYAGAGSRMSPPDGLSLPWQQWGWQPKIDGVYARCTTDAAGRLVSVRSRADRELSDAADLLGVVCGPPLAVLVGELEAHTEAGNRLAAGRGWRNLHLFDCLRSEGHDVSAAPYTARLGELHRAHAAIEQTAAGRIAPMQPDPRTFTWSMPTDGSRPPRRRTRQWSRAMVHGGPPRDLRRFPIVPLMRGPAAAADLWRSFVATGGGEGLVAVRLDAPAGGRGSKRKIKATDSLDCRVVAVDSTHAELEYGGRTFVVSARSRLRLAPGQLVECACDGWFESSVTPRFARVVRIREDLPDAPC